jgi:GNAT superfamily N-acetyltransferase
MSDILEINRIQNFLRESARGHYESLALPPFTLFFHPTDNLKYFNYAIPDIPCGGSLRGVLTALRQEFRQRERVARFEFFEAFAPLLPACLRDSGFVEEDRQWSMLCTPRSLQPVPDVPGLEIIPLDPSSSLQDTRDFLIAQHEGFTPEEKADPSAERVQLTRQGFTRSHAFLGRIAGQPAGAAVFARPIEGVTEVAGIATRVDYRRRGIAAALTAHATRAAFNLGVQTACLTAADERAGRVYERVGFVPFSIMLAYIDA